MMRQEKTPGVHAMARTDEDGSGSNAHAIFEPTLCSFRGAGGAPAGHTQHKQAIPLLGAGDKPHQ